MRAHDNNAAFIKTVLQVHGYFKAISRWVFITFSSVTIQLYAD